MKKIIPFLLLLSACATLQGASGSTGKVDLGNGYLCSGTVGALDPIACTKGLAWVCEVPLPRAADNSCLLDPITAEVPFVPAAGWKCEATASVGPTPCTKVVAISCLIPVPGCI
jgi:hypothetical protein